MRISDWSSDVCSSDLAEGRFLLREHHCFEIAEAGPTICLWPAGAGIAIVGLQPLPAAAERQILFFRQTAACLDPIFGGMTCQPAVRLGAILFKRLGHAVASNVATMRSSKQCRGPASEIGRASCRERGGQNV